MSSLHWLEITPLWSAVGWTILHSLWQLTAVALGAALLLRLIPRRNARLRYLLLLGVLLLALCWSGGTLAQQWARAGQASQVVASDAITLDPGRQLTDLQARPAKSWSQWRQQWQRRLEPVAPYLTLIWLLGLAGSLGYLLLGALQLRRLSRCGLAPPDTTWLERFETLRRQMGVRRPAALWLSSRVDAPLTFGFFKPVVLAPVGFFTGLTPVQAEALLLHELAHIRRYDFVINIFQGLVEALFFYHPALWQLSRQIRREREHCCDDLVLAARRDPYAYADALTQIQFHHFSFQKRLVMSAKNDKGAFRHRIFRLFGQYERPSSPWKSILLLSVLICFVTSQAFVGAVEETRYEAEARVAVGTAQDTLPPRNQSKDRTVRVEKSGTKLRVDHFDAENPPLLVVDGEKRGQTVEPLKSIAPEEIKRINAFKGEKAVEKYGPESVEGVIEVWTKDQAGELDDIELLKFQPPQPEGAEDASGSVEVYKISKAAKPASDGAEGGQAHIRQSLEGEEQPLIVIDGENLGKDAASLNALSPEYIERINVLKGQKAMDKYGAEGEEGVIEVWTKGRAGGAPEEEVDGKATIRIHKSSRMDASVPMGQIDGFDAENPPLLVIDGEKQGPYGKEVLLQDRLDPNAIKSITVLKGKSARKKYGAEGEQGVIEIWTQKQHSPKAGAPSPDADPAEEVQELKVDEVAQPEPTIAPAELEAFPNPARDLVNVRFRLAGEEAIRLGVYTLDGKLVTTLADGRWPAGVHTSDWSVGANERGVYLVQLEVKGEGRFSRKVVVE